MVELADNYTAKANIYIINILKNKWKCEYKEERNDSYKKIQPEILKMKR